MISPDFKHYIITRFNLKQHDWTRDKNNNTVSVSDDDWLRERFEIFGNYCLPSVQAQICKNFKWLVYFDEDTDKSYRKRIDAIQQLFPNFFPKFIPGMKSLLGNIKSDIAAEASLESRIITTRLDNDDSLHENFIERIQALITSQNIVNGLIDVPNGYCLQIKPKTVLSATIQHSNAFITYIEPYVSQEALLTVMGKAHGQWAYSVKTNVIDKERLWMQIIHENNIINTVQGIIVNDEKELEKFNLVKKISFPGNSLSQVFYNRYIKFPLYLTKKKMKNLWIKRKWIFKQ